MDFLEDIKLKLGARFKLDSGEATRYFAAKSSSLVRCRTLGAEEEAKEASGAGVADRFVECRFETRRALLQDDV